MIWCLKFYNTCGLVLCITVSIYQVKALSKSFLFHAPFMPRYIDCMIQTTHWCLLFFWETFLERFLRSWQQNNNGQIFSFCNVRVYLLQLKLFIEVSGFNQDPHLAWVVWTIISWPSLQFSSKVLQQSANGGMCQACAKSISIHLSILGKIHPVLLF